MKTSTKSVHSLIKDVVNSPESPDDLAEDEQQFYRAIQKDLKNLERIPKNSTIKNIMDYSRLLKF